MNGDKEKNEIERITLKLEEKLLEIEKNKKEFLAKKENDKSLFELRKELQKLKSKPVIKNEEVKVDSKSKEVTREDVRKSIEQITKKEISKLSTDNSKLAKKTIAKIENVVKVKKEKIKRPIAEKQKVEKPTRNIEVNATVISIEREINKPTLAQIPEKKPIKEVEKKKIEVVPVTKNIKKVVVKENSGTNKIILIIIFIFALVFLGYLYKLRTDLDIEKEILEKKKEAQIDYSKSDAVFKEIEEEEEPMELQSIGQPETVSDSLRVNQ